MKEIKVIYGSGNDIVGDTYYTTNHEGIQKAIDYASSKGGGKIFITKGVYKIYDTSNTGDGAHSIRLTSNIELYGEGKGTVLKPTIDDTSNHSCVISAIGTSTLDLKYRLENITIRDLVIGTTDNENETYHGYIGIYCCNIGKTYPNNANKYSNELVGTSSECMKGITIKNCTIKNIKGYGIYLNTSNNSNITSNTIQNNLNVGIILDNSSNNNITSNTAQNNNNTGISVNSSSTNNNITSNTAQNNNGTGIYLSNSSNSNNITSNTVQNNRNYGICLGSSSNSNNITSNTVQNNGGTGICLGSSSNSNNITSNTVQNNNSNGIISNSSNNNNNITSNTIQNNIGNGICLGSSSNSNNITSNTVQNNNSNGIYSYNTSNNNNITSNNSVSNYNAQYNISGGTNNVYNL